MLLPSRAGRVLATITLTLLAALVAVASAIAAEKAIWGPTTLPNGSSAFELYSELGVDSLQLSVSWANVAPTRPAAPTDRADPAYRWPPEIAAAAAEAAKHRVRLALLVSGTPPWANGGRSSIWAPDDAQDYANFLTAAARRYPNVRRWMIWGEPNKAERFQPNKVDDPVGPRAYARLLDAAYAALKGANPRNNVIGGMTWTGDTVKPPDFVRWMRLPNGRPPRLDWFGHNPFPFRFPDLRNPPFAGGFRDISDLDTLGREIDESYGRSRGNPVPLWLSEYTIQSERGSDVFATYVSAHDQARYLTAGFRLADDLGERSPDSAGCRCWTSHWHPAAPTGACSPTHSDARKPSGPCTALRASDTACGSGAAKAEHSEIRPGGSGIDRLRGGSGLDRIVAGSGNDRISARDGAKDTINCGTGRDRVTADRRDSVSRNCERVSRR